MHAYLNQALCLNLSFLILIPLSIICIGDSLNESYDSSVDNVDKIYCIRIMFFIE